MHGNIFTCIPRIVPTTLELDLCMGQFMHGDLCPATFLHLDMHDKLLNSHQKCVGRFFAFMMFRMCPPLTSLSKFSVYSNLFVQKHLIHNQFLSASPPGRVSLIYSHKSCLHRTQ